MTAVRLFLWFVSHVVQGLGDAGSVGNDHGDIGRVQPFMAPAAGYRIDEGGVHQGALATTTTQILPPVCVVDLSAKQSSEVGDEERERPQ